MRKMVECLTLAVCLAGLGEANAAYVITLKNGNEFVTVRYWEAGRQVLFDTYGGVFGVDKGFVAKIAASDKPMTPLAAIIEAPELKRQSSSVKDEPEPKQQPPASTQEKNQGSRADDPIFKEFDALKEKFKGLEGMLTSELQDFSTDLTNLKRKIQTSGKSNDYLREFTAIFEMGDALEAALTARR